MAIEQAWENSQFKQHDLKEKTKKTLQSVSADSIKFKDELNDLINKQTIPINELSPKRKEYFTTAPEKNALMLSHKHLSDSDAVVLSERLGKTSHDALILSHNNIGDTGTIAISNALKNNTSTNHLILSHNKITDFAAAALADMLKVNHFIGWLVLNNNKMGTTGALQLAEGIKVNTSIKHIVLAENNIESKGATKLFNAIKGKENIQSLFLQGNPIDNQCLTALKSCISDPNCQLRVIDLRDTKINELSPELQGTAKEKNIRILINRSTH